MATFYVTGGTIEITGIEVNQSNITINETDKTVTLTPDLFGSDATVTIKTYATPGEGQTDPTEVTEDANKYKLKLADADSSEGTGDGYQVDFTVNQWNVDGTNAKYQTLTMTHFTTVSDYSITYAATAVEKTTVARVDLATVSGIKTTGEDGTTALTSDELAALLPIDANKVITVSKDALDKKAVSVSGSNGYTLKLGEGITAPTEQDREFVYDNENSNVKYVQPVSAGYTLANETNITYAAAVDGKSSPLATITGLKTDLGATLTEYVSIEGTEITIEQEALTTGNVSINTTGSYTLKLGELDSSHNGTITNTLTADTNADSRTVSYIPVTAAKYEIPTTGDNAGKIVYTASSTGTVIATVTGLNTAITTENVGQYLTIDDTNHVIKILQAGALVQDASKTTKIESGTDTYSFELDGSITQAADGTEKTLAYNGTAVEYRLARTPGYVHDNANDTIKYDASTYTVLTTITGLKAGLTDEQLAAAVQITGEGTAESPYVITVNSDALPDATETLATVTATGNYKFVLGTGIQETDQTSQFVVDDGKVVYQTPTKKSYELANSDQTINCKTNEYNGTTKVLATISGVKTKGGEPEADLDSTALGELFTVSEKQITVKEGALNSANVTIEDGAAGSGYTLALGTLSDKTITYDWDLTTTPGQATYNEITTVDYKLAGDSKSITYEDNAYDTAVAQVVVTGVAASVAATDLVVAADPSDATKFVITVKKGALTTEATPIAIGDTGAAKDKYSLALYQPVAKDITDADKAASTAEYVDEWSVAGTTAKYQTVTKTNYSIGTGENAGKIVYSETATAITGTDYVVDLLQVTGLKSGATADKITLGDTDETTGKTSVIVAANALPEGHNNKVTLSGTKASEYALALPDLTAETSDVWSVKNGVATYEHVSKVNYAIVSGEIVCNLNGYETRNTLIQIEGVSTSLNGKASADIAAALGFTAGNTTLTVTKSALAEDATKNLKITTGTGYTLALVADTKTIENEWKFDGTTAKYQAVTKSKYFVENGEIKYYDTEKEITDTTDSRYTARDTLTTLSGVKEGTTDEEKSTIAAAITVGTGADANKITVAAAALDGKDVTKTDKTGGTAYTIVLGTGTVEDVKEWSVAEPETGATVTTATYQTVKKSHYTLDENGKIVYHSELQTLASGDSRYSAPTEIVTLTNVNAGIYGKTAAQLNELLGVAEDTSNTGNYIVTVQKDALVEDENKALTLTGGDDKYTLALAADTKKTENEWSIASGVAKYQAVTKSNYSIDGSGNITYSDTAAEVTSVARVDLVTISGISVTGETDEEKAASKAKILAALSVAEDTKNTGKYIITVKADALTEGTLAISGGENAENYTLALYVPATSVADKTGSTAKYVDEWSVTGYESAGTAKYQTVTKTHYTVDNDAKTISYSADEKEITDNDDITRVDLAVVDGVNFTNLEGKTAAQLATVLVVDEGDATATPPVAATITVSAEAIRQDASKTVKFMDGKDGGYTFKLAADTKSTENEWNISGTTAQYQAVTKSNYFVDGSGNITYSDTATEITDQTDSRYTARDTLTTLSGVKEGTTAESLTLGDTEETKTVITVAAAALDGKGVTKTDKTGGTAYTIVLADDTTSTENAWKFDGTTAQYQTVTKSNYFVDSASGNITYSNTATEITDENDSRYTARDTLTTLTDIKAGTTDEEKTAIAAAINVGTGADANKITVAAAALDGKDVTKTDKTGGTAYTIVLDAGTVEDVKEWTVAEPAEGATTTTVKYQTVKKSHYTLDENGKIVYHAELQTLASGDSRYSAPTEIVTLTNVNADIYGKTATELATLLGVAKDGDTDKYIVTVQKDALVADATKALTLTGGADKYTLALAADTKKTENEWSIASGTAKYQTVTKSNYSLNNTAKTITYSATASELMNADGTTPTVARVNLATVSGLNTSLTAVTDDLLTITAPATGETKSTITVSKDALTIGNVVLTKDGTNATDDYKLALAPIDPTPTYKCDKTSETTTGETPVTTYTAEYKLVETDYYRLDEDSTSDDYGKIVYKSEGYTPTKTTLFKISGIKSEAADALVTYAGAPNDTNKTALETYFVINDEAKTITVKKDATADQTITLAAGSDYTLVRAEDLTFVAKDDFEGTPTDRDPYWTVSGNKAIYKQDMQTNYTLSADGKTLTYSKDAKDDDERDITVATITGVNSKLANLTGNDPEKLDELFVFDGNTIKLAGDAITGSDYIKIENGKLLGENATYGEQQQVNYKIALGDDVIQEETSVWSFANGKATYDKVTPPTYTVKDTSILISGGTANTNTTKNLVTIDGLNSSYLTGMTATELKEALDFGTTDATKNVITIAAKALGTGKVTLTNAGEDKYTIALGTGTLKHAANGEETLSDVWVVNKGVLTKYSSSDIDATKAFGYTVDNDATKPTVTYTAPTIQTNATPIYAISGLATTVVPNGAGNIPLDIDSDTITIPYSALNAKAVTLTGTGENTLAFDDDEIIEHKDDTLPLHKTYINSGSDYESDGVTLKKDDITIPATVPTSGTLAVTQKIAKGYTLSADGKSIFYTNKATDNITLASITGLKSNATVGDSSSDKNIQIDVEEGTVTLTADAINDKTVKVTGNYTLVADDIPETEDAVNEWSLSNTTATYKLKTAGTYAISEDFKSLTYTGTDTTVLTVTGVNSKLNDTINETLDNETYTNEDPDVTLANKVAAFKAHESGNEYGYTEAGYNEVLAKVKADNPTLTDETSEEFIAKLDAAIADKIQTDELAARIAAFNANPGTNDYGYTAEQYNTFLTKFKEDNPTLTEGTDGYNDALAKAIEKKVQGDIDAETAAAKAAYEAERAEMYAEEIGKYITIEEGETDSETGVTTYTVTVKQEALGTGTFKIAKGAGAGKNDVYELKLDEDVPDSADESDGWFVKGTTVSIQENIPAYYEVDTKTNMSIAYHPAAAVAKSTPKVSLTGLKTTDLVVNSDGKIAGITTSDGTGDDEGKTVIKLSASVLNGKTVKISAGEEKANYVLALDTDNTNPDEKVTLSTPVNKWAYASGKLTLSDTQSEGYALSDDKMTVNYYADNYKGTLMATITNLAKAPEFDTDGEISKTIDSDNDGTDDAAAIEFDNGKVIIRDKELLKAGTAIAGKGNYNFQLELPAPAAGNEPEYKWDYDAKKKTLTYQKTVKEAGFEVDATGKKIQSVAANGTVALIAITGLTADQMQDIADKDAAGTAQTLITVDQSAGTVKLNASVLGKAKITGKGSYTLTLDDTLTNADETNGWFIKGTTATWQKVVPEHYEIKNNVISYVAPKAVEKNATPTITIENLKSGAMAKQIGYTGTGTEITLGADIIGVNAKKPTKVSSGYTLALGTGTSETNSTDWVVKGTTATLTKTVPDKYTLGDSNTTITYAKGLTTKLATISGIGKGLTETEIKNALPDADTITNGSTISISDTLLEGSSTANRAKTLKVAGGKDIDETTGKATVKTAYTLALANDPTSEAGWYLNGTTAEYYAKEDADSKALVTGDHFEADTTGTQIKFSSKAAPVAGAETTVTVTGIKKNATSTGALTDSQIAISGTVVEIKNASILDQKGSIVTGGTFAETANIKKSTEARTWKEGTTAKLVQKHAAGYTLSTDGKYITYSSKAQEVTLATVNGFKSKNMAPDTMSGNDMNIELDGNMLNNKVTVDGIGYTFDFNSDFAGSSSAMKTITGNKNGDNVKVAGEYVNINTAAGDDNINVTGSNNVINAGKGDDTITLGTGTVNTIVYANGDGNDVINGYNGDTIQITALTKADVTGTKADKNHIDYDYSSKTLSIVKNDKEIGTITLDGYTGTAANIKLQVKDGKDFYDYTLSTGSGFIGDGLADEFYSDNYIGSNNDLGDIINGGSTFSVGDIETDNATDLTKNSTPVITGSSKK